MNYENGVYTSEESPKNENANSTQPPQNNSETVSTQQEYQNHAERKRLKLSYQHNFEIANDYERAYILASKKLRKKYLTRSILIIVAIGIFFLYLMTVFPAYEELLDDVAYIIILFVAFFSLIIFLSVDRKMIHGEYVQQSNRYKEAVAKLDRNYARGYISAYKNIYANFGSKNGLLAPVIPNEINNIDKKQDDKANQNQQESNTNDQDKSTQ